MNVFDFLSIGNEQQPVVGHWLSGTVTAGTSSFSFYINKTYHTQTTGGTKVTVDVDSDGNWNWDNPEGYTVNALAGAFYQSSLLKSITFGEAFDYSKLTDLEGLCCSCSNLTSVDFTNLDSSNVTTMEMMFANCKSLVSLDLSNLNTSKVSEIMRTFWYCDALTNLDLTSWTTSQIRYSWAWEDFVPNSRLLTVKYKSSQWNSSITDAFASVKWTDVA